MPAADRRPFSWKERRERLKRASCCHPPSCKRGPTAFPPPADRLGRLEELIERLEAENRELTERMESLRGQGRTRSCRFKEAMGLKGFKARIPALLKKHINRPPR